MSELITGKLPMAIGAVMVFAGVMGFALGIGNSSSSLFTSSDYGSGSTHSDVGSEAINISGTTIDGDAFDLEKERGKVVVIDFWATWCPPCREKAPRLTSLHAQYDSGKVKVIGVSGDNDPDKVTRYFEDTGNYFPTIQKDTDRLFKAYRVTSIPTIIVIDPEGTIAFRGHGGGFEEVVEELASAL